MKGIVQFVFEINPITGMLLTIGCYWLGQIIYEKMKWTVLQPILTSSIFVILILTYSEVPYQTYYEQNSVLNYILPLTAVVLAVPLYQNLHILKKHLGPILIGIVAGTLVTIAVMIGIGRLIGTDLEIIVSMVPKSATNPIAMEVSKIIGGIPSLTVALVVITGIFGGILGPELLNLLRIKNKIARGIALGTISHAIGTARAFKEGELEGSMSSLAIALAGTLTAILSPFVAYLLNP